MFFRRPSRVVVGLAVAAGLAFPAPALAHPSAARYTPGAPGLGDPYFSRAGNGGYDVKHYDLKLDYTPATRHLKAVARITATATQDLSRFNLDYSGPAIRGVWVNGGPAAHRRDGQELIVTPRRGLPKGERFTVKVEYAGRPAAIKNKALGTVGWIHTKDGAVALNEPTGARTWFPVNDHPSDKATYTFHITTPSGVTALANGERDKVELVKNGRTTVTWRMRKPMASYLAMVAIGDYKVKESRSGGVWNLTAYDPRLAAEAKDLHRTTAEAVKWGRKVFGPYPFRSTGGIVDDLGVLYALETQSRPVYDRTAEKLTIVHELAHQWFGDSVTPKTWRDIWLNEGFATYAEWLWLEQHGGSPTEETVRVFTPKGAEAKEFWKRKTGDPGRDHMFDRDAVYLRGAMTLHALRKRIGDKTFFKLLPAWTAKYRGGNAGTADFIALAEEMSGKELDDLFDAWLYTSGKP
jgi:aminopeptidase N